jgi:uncharacterized protein YifN (PemK superfamily)
MAIQGTPRSGTILMCDFAPHELELLSDGNMLKTRPVIALNTSLPGRGKLIQVVPISMTAPERVMPWHVEVPIHCMPAASQHKEGVRWAKCDMVVTAGWSRLNRYEGPRRGGRIVYQDGYLDRDTMIKVKLAIAHVFGIRQSLWTLEQSARTVEVELQAAVTQVNEGSV